MWYAFNRNHHVELGENELLITEDITILLKCMHIYVSSMPRAHMCRQTKTVHSYCDSGELSSSD